MRKLVYNLEQFLAFFAGLSILATICVVMADALFRHVLHTTLPSVNEIIESFLILPLVFFGGAITQRSKKHLSVHFIVEKLPVTVGRIIEFISTTLSMLFIALLGYLSFRLTLEAFETNELNYGQLVFPMYLSYGILPVGLLVFTLRYMIDFYDQLMMIIKPNSEAKPEPIADKLTI